MKKIVYPFLAAAALLIGNYFFPTSALDTNVKSSVSAPSPTLIPLPGVGSTPGEARDPYGEVYLSIAALSGSDETSYRLAWLPGSCIVGLMECPEAEILLTPFNVKDVWNDGTGIAWSPDGRYGLLVAHPEDELSAKKTTQELEKFKTQSPSEFNVSPSTLFIFDTQKDEWSEVYRAERKFFSSPHWSPDGQWIAFEVGDDPWAFQPLSPDNGIYIIHPDGSGLRHLSDIYANILGWVGDSILLQELQDINPSTGYGTSRFETLALDGNTKNLFVTDRLAYYTLAPDGGELLVADFNNELGGSSAQHLDVIALDGTEARSLGSFIDFGSSIFPAVWSPDGSMIAFANQQQVYVAAREGAGLTKETVEISHKVYEASDSLWNIQISSDNKFLLLDEYDGKQRFYSSFA
ncbi:MAG: PD40 domain-containing protein [Anaerolineales bacterium]|nr:PD40 domain-containing protein [Anaerolineales bacterium]